MKSPWIRAALCMVLTLAFPAVMSAQTDLHIIGSGSVETNCLLTLTESCSVSASGSMSGTGVNPGTYTIRIDTGSPHTLNGNPGGQGFCLPAVAIGQVVEAAGDTLQFNAVGSICEEGAAGSSYDYHATFRITGGTGRFLTSKGTGGMSGGFTRSGSSLLDIRGALQ
jgi:hypothetical protein